MALAFRNLTITPDAPVSEWPTKAVQAALNEAISRTGSGSLPKSGPIPGAGPHGKSKRCSVTHAHMASPRPWMRPCLAPVNEPKQASVRRSPSEIREAVKRSGLSRAEFASQVGTSASRLSTYVSGKVTPSATLMLRIRRVADRQSHDER